MSRILHIGFRIFDRIITWTTLKFTKPGLFVLSVLVISGALGVDTNLTVAYKLFTFLAAILGISFLWCIGFKPRISVKRSLPRLATAGQKFDYRIVFQNLSEKSLRGLYFKECIRTVFPTREEFERNPEPDEAYRNIFDRTVRYHRWAWLSSLKRGVTPKNFPLPLLPPHSVRETLSELLPLQRGRINIDGITIFRPDPFGLVNAYATIPAPESIAVLPRLYPIPGASISGSRQYTQGGESLAVSVGNSEEYLSLRDYQPGDPLRNIHWKACAKTGSIIVKERQDEFFIRCGLILDTFHESDYSVVFEEAVSVAASFISWMEDQESLLDLMFIGSKAQFFTSGRGIDHAVALLEILASVTPNRKEPFSSLASLVYNRAPLLSSCICVLLAWDDQRKDLIRILKCLGIPVTVIIVIAKNAPPINDPKTMEELNGRFYVFEAGKVEQGLARA
ncbi:MAG: DUF58 domain-containing protein [Pseudomonadota bacterium]